MTFSATSLIELKSSSEQLAQRVYISFPSSVPDWVCQQVPDFFESSEEAERFVIDLYAEIGVLQSSLDIEKQEAILAKDLGVGDPEEAVERFRPKWIALRAMHTKLSLVESALKSYRRKESGAVMRGANKKIEGLHARVNGLTQRLGNIESTVKDERVGPLKQRVDQLALKFESLSEKASAKKHWTRLHERTDANRNAVARLIYDLKPKVAEVVCPWVADKVEKDEDFGREF